MNNAYNWYTSLKKPSWAPPGWVFSPVWTALYILIAISFGRVFVLAGKGIIPAFVVWPFTLNLVFNFLFTTLQFKLRSNFLAAVDILLVLATLILAMIAIYPYATWIYLIQIPYLLWVMFATALQLTISYLNK